MVNRNAANIAQLKIREKCGSGDLKISYEEAFLLRSCACHLQVQIISKTEKLSDNIMITMYSRFIDPDRWPNYVSVAHDDRLTSQNMQASTTAGAAASGAVASESTTSVCGKTTRPCTGHKNGPKAIQPEQVVQFIMVYVNPCTLNRTHTDCVSLFC